MAKPGDKIAILAENHPCYFEVYWAAHTEGLALRYPAWRFVEDLRQD